MLQCYPTHFGYKTLFEPFKVRQMLLMTILSTHYKSYAMHLSSLSTPLLSFLIHILYLCSISEFSEQHMVRCSKLASKQHFLEICQKSSSNTDPGSIALLGFHHPLHFKKRRKGITSRKPFEIQIDTQVGRYMRYKQD